MENTAIAHYRLLEQLGEGGAGVVYKAIDERSGEMVALKTAREPREGSLASIRREIESLRQIRHHGVVRILEGGIDHGRPWHAMELLLGETLADQLHTLRGETSSSESATAERREHSTLIGTSLGAETTQGAPVVPSGTIDRSISEKELRKLLTVFRRVCEPLAYIHGEGLIHRDLKPTNIFVREDGLPVLVDFGLGLFVQRDAGREVLAVEAGRAGTIAYMAPEQLRGERLDARADLFALGCTMYQAITGRLPFDFRSRDQLIELQETRKPPPPSSLAAVVAPALDELILRLLAVRPTDRVGHASDVAAALEQLGAEQWPYADDPRPRSYLYRPEIVGREDLEETYRRHVDRLREGHGGLLLLSGESGIGKTSLLAEAARQASLRGIATVSGECIPLGVGEPGNLRSAGPLHPFQRLLLAILDRCVAGGAAQTERLLGDRAHVLAACEPMLRQAPGASAQPTPPELPAEASRRRLLEALAASLGAMSVDRPLLLVLDDLQWADDLTLAFLATLPPSFFEAQRVLILAAFRSEESRPEIEALAGLQHVESVRVDRLDLPAVRAMTQAMLAAPGTPEEFLKFLATESGGNPFFVAEYLRAAVEQRLLVRDIQGSWRPATTGPTPNLPLPSSLRELILHRLEGLTAGARRVAEVAAVLGRECSTEMVASLAVGDAAVPDEGSLFGCLGELRGREILDDLPNGNLRFQHDKLREVAYQGISKAARTVLHRRAGLLIEDSHRRADSLALVLPELALHFEQAEENDKAISYLDQAGESAHRTFANKETIKFLERARTLEKATGLMRDPVARARRERLVGEAYSGLGDPESSLRCLLDSAQLLEVPFPASKARVAIQSLFEVMKESTRRLAPAISARHGLASRERNLELSHVFEKLPSVFYYVTGDAGQVLCAALMNLSLSERVGPSSELAIAYVGMHITAGFVPLHGLAEFYGRRARDLLKRIDDPIAETWVLVNTAAYAIGTCQWDRALSDTGRIREVARHIGFHRRWEEGTGQLGTTLFMMGDFEGSRRAFEDLRVSAERGDAQTHDWALVGLAQIHLMQGRVSQALALLADAERLLHRGLGRAEQIYTLGPLALAHLRAGDVERARSFAEACAEWIAKGSPIAYYNVYAYACVTEVFASLFATASDEREKAVLFAAAKRAVKQLQAIARVFPVGASRAELWRGALQVATGARERAGRSFEKSLALSKKYGMIYDEALAELALGRDAMNRENPEKSLARAADLLVRVGATHGAESISDRR